MTPLSEISGGIYPILDASWFLSRQTCNEHQERLQLAREIHRLGIGMVQLRCKGDSLPCFKYMQQWLEILRQEAGNCRVILNDHPLWVRDLDADGVHVGQEDETPSQCRKILGPQKIIGLSTHNTLEIAAATQADYVGFGPIFPTSSKHNTHPVQGVPTLAQAVIKSPLPVVAIGGLALQHLPLLAQQGVWAAAMIGGLWNDQGQSLLAQAVMAWPST